LLYAWPQLQQAFSRHQLATPASELGKLTADLHFSISNPTTVGLKNSNRAESQDKDSKISIMNMFKNLRENMEKSINENRNKQRNEMKKIIQGEKKRKKIVQNQLRET
jgi:N-acetylmuramoyl-L-alanine amidase CwlA